MTAAGFSATISAGSSGVVTALRDRALSSWATRSRSCASAPRSSATSLASMPLTAGAAPPAAADLANIAAGLVVMKLGTATVSAAELRAAVEAV